MKTSKISKEIPRKVEPQIKINRKCIDIWKATNCKILRFVDSVKNFIQKYSEIKNVEINNVKSNRKIDS